MKLERTRGISMMKRIPAMRGMSSSKPPCTPCTPCTACTACTACAACAACTAPIVSGLINHYVGRDLPWWAWALVTIAIVHVRRQVGIELGFSG
jgi:hypothetical protein